MVYEQREQAEFHGDVQWLDRFHNIFINLLEARRERNAFLWYNELINLYLEVISVMTNKEDETSHEHLTKLKMPVNEWVNQCNEGDTSIQPVLMHALMTWERVLRIAFKKTGLQFKTKEDMLDPEHM